MCKMPSTKQKTAVAQVKVPRNVVSTKKINVQEKELSERNTPSAEGYKTKAVREKKRATARVYSKRAYHADPEKQSSF